MRIPSRNMPKYSFKNNENSNNIFAIILIFSIYASLLFILLYGFYKEPMQGLSILGIISFIIMVSTIVEKRRLRNLALERKGEDIGTFARSFEFRKIDTWIIRAVYEELLEYRYFKEGVAPIRASDNLRKDIRIDDELIEIFDIVIQRTNRTPDDMESNPYYASLSTVKDLVLFLDYQPRVERSSLN